MKPSTHIVFFPGKGFYTLPEGQEILAVYKTAAARKALSSLFEGRSVLQDFYLKEFGELPQINSSGHEMERVSFSAARSVGTRISNNAKDINWAVIENYLSKKGYTVKERKHFGGELETLCPVYLLQHPTMGVISEGKGLTAEQSKKSALAEAIERISAEGPSSEARGSICIDTYDHLYKDKVWNLGTLEGPRDLFCSKIVTEWLPARNITRDENCFFPAERAYYQYIPSTTHTRLFSLHHTMGLSAGSSLEDAALSGIFEIIERDAYWITMRCKINCPDINLEEVSGLDPKVTEIVSLLKQKGFQLFLKDMSLDWGVPVAHAVLMDSSGRIPAFAHGTGASLDWSTAVTRAVCEVVQMYTGLEATMTANFKWEEVVSVAGVLGQAELAWSDPLYAPHIQHLISNSSALWNKDLKLNSADELLQLLRRQGHEVIVADLLSDSELKVVRVFVTGATEPDSRLERISARLIKWQEKEGLDKGLYSDPILT